jgi:uncharacterized protein involved in exopolysaccharide biosynthesis
MDQSDSFSLHDLLTVLFRHGRSILLVTLVSVLAAGLYLAMCQKQYTAVTRVLVSLGREKFEDLGLQTQPMGNLVFQERAQNINNEVEILRDTALVLHALPALKARLAQSPLASRPPGIAKRLRTWASGLLIDAGLMQKPDPDTSLALRLYKAIAVTAVKETDVIDVTFTWNDPAFAADALNLYIDAYNKQHLRVYETKHSVSFFQGQLQKAQAELAAATAAQTAFLHAGGVNNLDVEKTQLLAELASLRQEVAGVRIDQDAAEIKLAAVNGAFASGGWIDTEDAANAAEGTQVLDQSFVQLMDQRTRLLSRFEPGAEPVQDIDRQIARLRSQKEQALTSFYRSRLAALADKVSRLDAQIASREQALRGMTDQTAAYDAIQRRLTAATSLVEEYRRKLEQLEVSSEMNASDLSSVRVLSEASPPVLPSFPKPALMLGLALGLGLLAGLAYAVVAEFLGRTFHQPGQVSRVLRLPVLATIPDLPA